jgi:hypothetical protein
MKLILAGCHNQFYEWCAQTHTDPTHKGTRAKYIDKYEDFLDSPEGTELILYGDYWRNPLHQDFDQWEFILAFGRKSGWILPEGF